VIVKEAAGDGGPSDFAFTRKLLHCKKPFMRVPNLCIHLQSPAERASFTINKETHLAPILGVDMEIMTEEALNITDGRHSPAFLLKLAKELGCAAEDIQDFDLTLCDTQVRKTPNWPRSWANCSLL
jgi:aspartyl aminopeptidase